MSTDQDTPIGKHGPYGTHTKLDGSRVPSTPEPAGREPGGADREALRCEYSGWGLRCLLPFGHDGLHLTSSGSVTLYFGTPPSSPPAGRELGGFDPSCADCCDPVIWCYYHNGEPPTEDK